MHARLDPALEHVRLRLKSHIDLELPKKTLADHPTLSYWLTKEQGAWEDIGVEFNVKVID
jgi:exopolyphosphatase/guanosine-5'-triphosphate,3'-diphosphate pyrophosphatase